MHCLVVDKAAPLSPYGLCAFVAAKAPPTKAKPARSCRRGLGRDLGCTERKNGNPAAAQGFVFPSRMTCVTAPVSPALQNYAVWRDTRKLSTADAGSL